MEVLPGMDNDSDLRSNNRFPLVINKYCDFSSYSLKQQDNIEVSLPFSSAGNTLT